MARSDFVERTREILYGTDIGEAPALRAADSNANETLSAAGILTFDLATGEDELIEKGDILSINDTSDPTKCFVLYVTNVTNFGTPQAVGVNGYLGSPSVTGADSGDLDDAIFEQNPLVTTFKIHKAVDSIFATALYPHIYNIETTTVTPDLATYQVELPADTMKIIRAAQVIGNQRLFVPARLHRNEHTTVSSTGVLADISFEDGSTCYLTTATKFAVGDEDEADNGLVEIVATGAAALCLGATVSDQALARHASDSPDRGQQDVAALLWRDFITLRDSYSEGLSREVGDRFYVDRG